ncbi:hypothetical protein [Nocardia wallacei]|uniref:hypothetical protein n=1 Tax=Nocardia wallacei TaxID=480035 RepID=UPI0024560C64|nr:hypothetical protein [Nocardia wallacei]
MSERNSPPLPNTGSSNPALTFTWWVEPAEIRTASGATILVGGGESDPGGERAGIVISHRGVLTALELTVDELEEAVGVLEGVRRAMCEAVRS